MDSNDVLIPDPSLMPFLYGLCHQHAKMNSSYCVFVTYLQFLIPISDRVFSPRETFRQITFHIRNPCGSSAFEDEEWSFRPALLSSGVAHGKRQKGPLAETAAAGDSDLPSPLAYPYRIHNAHTGFVILFHCLGLHTDFLQSHTVIITDHRQTHRDKSILSSRTAFVNLQAIQLIFLITEDRRVRFYQARILP